MPRCPCCGGQTEKNSFLIKEGDYSRVLFKNGDGNDTSLKQWGCLYTKMSKLLNYDEIKGCYKINPDFANKVMVGAVGDVTMDIATLIRKFTKLIETNKILRDKLNKVEESNETLLHKCKLLSEQYRHEHANVELHKMKVENLMFIIKQLNESLDSKDKEILDLNGEIRKITTNRDDLELYLRMASQKLKNQSRALSKLKPSSQQDGTKPEVEHKYYYSKNLYNADRVNPNYSIFSRRDIPLYDTSRIDPKYSIFEQQSQQPTI